MLLEMCSVAPVVLGRDEGGRRSGNVDRHHGRSLEISLHRVTDLWSSTFLNLPNRDLLI